MTRAAKIIIVVTGRFTAISGSFTVASPWERRRNNFLNYASQLQAAFVRSQIPKILK